MDIVLTGIHGIKGRLKKIEKSIFAKQMMGEIGLFLRMTIIERTQKGNDVDGISFKPYNKLYAKERQKKGYQTNFVDLTRTGSMMASLNSDATSKQVELSFMNTNDPDGGNNPSKAYFLNEEREFFAVSDLEIKKIMVIVDNYYQKIMRASSGSSQFIERDSF